MIIKLILGAVIGGVIGLILNLLSTKVARGGFTWACTSNPYVSVILGIALGLLIASGWGRNWAFTSEYFLMFAYIL